MKTLGLVTNLSIGDPAAQAEHLLDTFSTYTDYKHGAANPFLAALEKTSHIMPQRAIDFLGIWYSFSRRTPQILLNCAAAYADAADRHLIMANYTEEDGLTKDGDDPHYDLLEKLIGKMGGQLLLNPRTEDLIMAFLAQCSGLTAARATGVVSGFEHPALDITRILAMVVKKSGYHGLLETDPYLTIHVAVEPAHIVWSHSTSLRYMRLGHHADVIAGFQFAMKFWSAFWMQAFDALGVRLPDAYYIQRQVTRSVGDPALATA